MPGAAQIKLVVNGKECTVLTDPDRPLLDVLREDLSITGPKYGCGEGACGACSVIIDEKRIFSCSTPVQQVAGKSITTIEGLASNGALNSIQQAFLDEQAFQCGFCTPGMIICAVALLKETPHPSNRQIIEGMNGNICRCCTYSRIITAIKRASEMEDRDAGR